MNSAAKKTVVAAFLGWTLDAFDFFLLTFVITRIAATFGRSIPEVAFAITLTLACRPLGALLFGWIADRYGRRMPLMIDIACFSAIELLTAFSPNITMFMVLRALYGIAMGGEWGLGAAMAMEVLPAQRRGIFSGLLQEGYMVGFLLAALTYFTVFQFTHWNWRALFVIGALPALLILYIRKNVPESPVLTRSATAFSKSLFRNWGLVLYAVAFMAAFNGMSHGTQDLYATFLQKQRGFSPGITSMLSIVAAVGAIAGGILCGALSQRFGRRPVIIVCAALAGCAIPLWLFSPTIALLALGGFGMQFMVQGAWGVIPAHLNELSPGEVRATFPGFTYQLGNLIAAGVTQVEAVLAQRWQAGGGELNYAAAMAVVVAFVLACVAILSAAGYFVRKENRQALFTVKS